MVSIRVEFKEMYGQILVRFGSYRRSSERDLIIFKYLAGAGSLTTQPLP